ncbi:MAG: hypothetical protein HXK96_00980 [Candidatus Nanogingivalaceae bacterium]|nr:hypothetical protein [Candidatus Nanogingivalaceae bacterium]
MKRRKIIFGLVLVVAILSLGANIFQFIRYNNDVTAVKSPVGTVCNDKIIDKYNNIKGPKDAYEKNSKALGEEIAKMSGNEKDANCVAIRFLIGTNNQQETYKTLKALVEKGQSPSLKIANIRNIYKMDPSGFEIESVGDALNE